MMIEREDISLELEVDTSEGKRMIPLQIKPLARCIGCCEMTKETAMLVKEAIYGPFSGLMKEVQGLDEYAIEKVVNLRFQEAIRGTVEEEFYRQVSIALRNLRVASPAEGGAPPSDEEMAMLIETFLNYPGMDSSCLIALSVAAAQKAFALDLGKERLQGERRDMALNIMAPMFAKALQAHLKKGTSTLDMIKSGRSAHAVVESIMGKIGGP